MEEQAKYEVINMEVESKPSDMIMAAVKGGADLEKLERLLNLQILWEANEAKKSYHVAMSKFKMNPPKIWRDMQVKYGTGNAATSWTHSDLATSSESINKSLGENGLNSGWRTEQTDSGDIKVTCIITHELGHSESTWLKAPPDKTGAKNDIQAIGSTIFYLERYTLFAITGLAPSRMDDDGHGTAVNYITDEQQSTIVDMMIDTGADEAKFLEYLKVDSLEHIPEAKYNVAMAALKAKKSKGGKK